MTAQNAKIQNLEENVQREIAARESASKEEAAQRNTMEASEELAESRLLVAQASELRLGLAKAELVSQTERREITRQHQGQAIHTLVGATQGLARSLQLATKSVKLIFTDYMEGPDIQGRAELIATVQALGTLFSGGRLADNVLGDPECLTAA